MPRPTSDPLVIGVGASAGGVETLSAFVAGLDPDLPAAVLVVLHQSADAPGVLPDLLDRRCPLPVQVARDREALELGHVYVAPPDHHLVVRDRGIAVTRGPKENGHRPGVDPLFRSLALEYGPSAVAIVLSGMLDDGAAGILAVVRHGGTAVVQDPEESLYPGMPEAALRQVPGALVAPAAKIGPLLTDVLGRPQLGDRRPSSELRAPSWRTRSR